MMKKLLFPVLILFMFSACNQKDKARIKINIPELKNKTVIVQEQRVDGAKILDTIKFSNKGKINYSLKVKQTGFYNLIIPGSSNIYLVLSPEDKIEAKGKPEGKSLNLKIDGSSDSERLNMLYDSLFVTRDILDDVREKYNSTENAEEKQKLYDEYVGILDNYRKFSMKYILDDLTSVTSVVALYQEVGPDLYVFGRRRDLQFFKLATDSLTKYYPKNRHVLALQRNFNKMMDNYQVEKIMNQVGDIEEGLPDLKLPDVNGTDVSLKSMKERYILLNFWHPSDEVSNQLFSDINTTFKKYHPKGFGIYNVYLGKSTTAWKKILNFEEINNWVNVSDTSFPYSQTRLVYNVVTIPSNYLIDFNKKEIIAKDINPTQLNQMLSDLVK